VSVAAGSQETNGSPQDGAPEEGAASYTNGVSLSFGFGTDRGLRRELNEDAFLAADPIFAVADGMGGHEAGEVASRECISVLSQQTVLAAGSRSATAADLQLALRQADARIREISNARAGTTVTGVVLVEERRVPYWLVFNVGDSRTYRLSQGSFGQISVDHSEVQELVDGGFITPAEALVHPRRHVVTRALGTGTDTEADFWLIPVEDGDRILICSDGLTGEVSDEGIHRALSTLDHPQDVVDSLIQAALRSGGRDNVTVVVVDAAQVDGTDPETRTKPSAPEEEDTLPRLQEQAPVPSAAPAGSEPAGSMPAAEEPAAEEPVDAPATPANAAPAPADTPDPYAPDGGPVGAGAAEHVAPSDTKTTNPHEENHG
jgi:serine/threonine protein phosphatase PrpC